MDRLESRNFKDLLPDDEEGEPHPADLLASLMRGENGGSVRRAPRPQQPSAQPPRTQAQPPHHQDFQAQPLHPQQFQPQPLRQQPFQPLPPQQPPPAQPAQQPTTVEGERFQPPPPPPVRALTAPPPAAAPAQPASGLQRVVRAMRSALPIVQGLLPLLDGNFAGVVSNALTTRPQAPPPPPPRLDLEPLEHGLQELRSQQREIRSQLVEQNSSIKRVEDQLEMVREATDRNTLEQQELVEDIKSVGNKMGRYAVAAFALLAMSIAMNVFLYLEFRHLIP